VGGSLAMLLAVFAIAVGSLLAIEYPVGVIAVLAAAGAVGVVVRSLTGWLSSPSRAASLRQRVRFGRRPRYRQ
jgi:NADH:ubiquinone oxidoreductase subunit 6 (subunit J)